MVSKLIIILNTIFSIIALFCIIAAIFKFKTNNFLQKYSIYEYKIALNKDRFRLDLFRIHIYDMLCCIFLFISMASRIKDDYRPYSDAYTMWFAFAFDLFMCMRCFKVWRLYRK